MLFIVDQMLGRLAKYMRFLGYDTYFPDMSMSDDEIIDIARKENRIIITRDKELSTRFGNSLYIKSDYIYDQLNIVIEHFSLSLDNILTRCSVCNTLLVPIAKKDVVEKVPNHVFKKQENFFHCPSCDRVYWYGTHTQNILRIINNAT